MQFAGLALGHSASSRQPLIPYPKPKLLKSGLEPPDAQVNPYLALQDGLREFPGNTYPKPKLLKACFPKL